MMKVLTGFFCSIIILFIMVFNIPLFASDEIGVENESYIVKLVRSEGIEGARAKSIFQKYDKRTKQDSTIKVENMITNVEKIEIVKDRMVFFGEVDHGGFGVSVIDLKLNKEIDFILCYRPRFSETKRYLIYEKFYPRFAPPEVQSDLILIYDLYESPERNRIGEEYKNIKRESIRIGGPEYLALSEDVGHPIYPEENVVKQTYRIWVSPPVLKHFVFPKGNYIWLDNDSKIVMLDKSEKETWLILVNLSEGLNKIKIKKIKLEVVLSACPQVVFTEFLL